MAHKKSEEIAKKVEIRSCNCNNSLCQDHQNIANLIEVFYYQVIESVEKKSAGD